ncbi:MAG TPA: S1 RNA-binding domain-containing protein [Thermoanaerobaculia bacterium]|nr:S1 RNA-binding domain-containing protein [Thermoanaerobaculia bacterium]
MNEQDTQNADFAQALAEFEQQGGGGEGGADQRKNPAVGERVKGQVVSVTDENVFIDIGAKAEAVMEAAQFKDAEGNLTINAGDSVEATVASIDAETGAAVLRKKAGGGRRGGGQQQQEIAAELRQAYENSLPVEGTVTAVNKGGVEVQVSGMRAFCPHSQLDLRYVQDTQQFIGQKLTFRITRLEEGRGRPNIILSRRTILEEEAGAKAAEARSRIEVGTVTSGKVTSLTSYGAFVDLGGIEGMLHVSEIGYARLAHPKEALSVGDEVEVQVIKIEKGKDGRDRISLSRRALERDPWKDVAENFTEGTEVAGRVMRLETFGAFVEIAPGIEGLVHISEMGAGRRLQHSREAAEVGQEVRVRVLGVDPDKRRVSLSMGSGSGAERTADRPERGERGGFGGGERERGRGDRGGSRGGDRGGDRNRGRGGRDRYDDRVAEPVGAPRSISTGSGFGSMADFFKNLKKND